MMNRPRLSEQKKTRDLLVAFPNKVDHKKRKNVLVPLENVVEKLVSHPSTSLLWVDSKLGQNDTPVIAQSITVGKCFMDVCHTLKQILWCRGLS
jgi:hypothetical protein